MAISFIGSAQGDSAANTDCTITLPGGMNVDDLIIVAYGIGDNDSVDQNVAMVTAGYTEVADLLGDDTQDISFGVYYKFHNGSDTTAVCDALAAGTDAAVAGVCMVFRGVAPVASGGPFDVAAVTAAPAAPGTAHADPPQISTFDETTSWVVIAGGSAILDAAASTYTFPTNYTTNAIGNRFDDTSDVVVGLGYRSSPGDPENPGLMTYAGTDSANYAWCAVTMALKEATAGTTTITVDTPGAVTFTGQAVGLSTSIAPTAGAITWNGQAVALTNQENVAAGQITWNGATDITLVTGGDVTVVVDIPGAVTWTGQAVGLTTTITPTAGAVTWTGQALGLRTSLALTAGAITWSGATDITVLVATVITVDVPGQVTWTGSSVGLTTSVGVAPGAITWAGATDITLVSSGPVVIVVDVPGAITWTGSVVTAGAPGDQGTPVKGPTRKTGLAGDDVGLDFETFWDGQAIDDLDIAIDAPMWDLDGNFLGITGPPRSIPIGSGANSLVEV